MFTQPGSRLGPEAPPSGERQSKRKHLSDGELEVTSPTPEGYSVSDEVLMSVVDAYFMYAQNQPYSFFHEGNFRRRLAQNELADHLVLAVVASAVRFCTHPLLPVDTHEVAVSYANKSWQSVISNCFGTSTAANVSIVQTIALLALFDFTAGKSRHGAAWVKIGMAVRIAQDLGLMLEPPADLSFADQEERRRVFWSVYLLDRLVSCGRGRPPAIVDACCQLQLPCDEQTWRDGAWQQTLTLDELANRTSPSLQRAGLFAHVIVMAYTVGRAAQYMLQEFNIRSRYPPWDPSSDFAAIEADLLHLESRLELDKPLAETLSPYYTPAGGADYHHTGPIIFSTALFHLCYCMLTHPFLLRRRLEIGQITAPSSFLARMFDTGWHHAQRMVELFQAANNHGCTFRSSFSGYCILIAGSIAACYTDDEDTAKRLKASNLLQDAITYLQGTGRYWRNVSTMVSCEFAYSVFGISDRPKSNIQGEILQHAAENTLVYSQLASQRSQIAPLAPEYSNTMWSLVDYSTISNETSASLAANQSTTADLWFDSWIDLFGMQYSTGDFGTDRNALDGAAVSQVGNLAGL
ncbi:hypothetical protein B0A52_05207 [Exophiala mesophila]|uniref:Xylanolytic transcriptional activator regulatory domain-containing protein n=1 Tax=Exophiala mesophila TaxID=212818 RepID=A0A438N474_EXOME|nr:hypothetical protein B0A52_05207 [Exophiala mesophila]